MSESDQFKKTADYVRQGMKAARREIDEGELLVKVLEAFMKVQELLDARKPEPS